MKRKENPVCVCVCVGQLENIDEIHEYDSAVQRSRSIYSWIGHIDYTRTTICFAPFPSDDRLQLLQLAKSRCFMFGVHVYSQKHMCDVRPTTKSTLPPEIAAISIGEIEIQGASTTRCSTQVQWQSTGKLASKLARKLAWKANWKSREFQFITHAYADNIHVIHTTDEHNELCNLFFFVEESVPTRLRLPRNHRRLSV